MALRLGILLATPVLAVVVLSLSLIAEDVRAKVSDLAKRVFGRSESTAT